MSAAGIMPLCRALHLLAKSHTRDDDLTGFVVMVGASRAEFISQDDYIEAWRSVRHAIGEAYDPPEQGEPRI